MRFLLFLIWLAFIGYAVMYAPGQSGFDDSIMMELFKLQSDEPLLIAVFSLLGVFPVAYCLILLRADRYSTPALPFALGSFVLGGFALLPYYFTVSLSPRRTNRTSANWYYFLTNRFTIFLVLLIAIGLIVYGLTLGNWSVYFEAFQQSHFVHVMTIDLVVMSFLSVIAIRKDRVIPYPNRLIPLIGLIPVVGLLIYTLVYAARPHRG